MLERLEHSMVKVRDASTEPAVIHIAAEVALTMNGKYYALTDDNEVYRIAIGKLHIRNSFHVSPFCVMKLCVPIKNRIGSTRTQTGV